MRWNTPDIVELLKYYIKKYFRNSIKNEIAVVWSRKLYNAELNNTINGDGAEAKMYTYTDGTHKLKLNTSLYNASPELMKNTLVHELIHAWQGEHGYLDEKPGMHGETFMKWCDKLNATGDFKYPLAPVASNKEDKVYKKSKNSGYYVYIMTSEHGNAANKYPIGIFINFLYLDECNWLKNKGFNIRYYTNLKPGSTAPSDLKSGLYQFNHYFLTLTFMKKNKVDSTNFIKKIYDEWGSSRFFDDTDFNFTNGVEV